jgi:hypothetical protein
MADKIKKFFLKKKADAKFKLAGPGHRLTEVDVTQKIMTEVNVTQKITSSGSSYTGVPRSEPSAESRQAAAAALARLGGQRQDHVGFNT